MNCEFLTTPLSDGRFQHICQVCGHPAITRAEKHHRRCDLIYGPPRPPPPPAPDFGPGTELHRMLLEDWGVEPWPGCACAHRIAAMNVWAETCGTEHREECLGWLMEAAEKSGWIATLPPEELPMAGAVLDGILSEAIRRAASLGETQPG